MYVGVYEGVDDRYSITLSGLNLIKQGKYSAYAIWQTKSIQSNSNHNHNHNHNHNKVALLNLVAIFCMFVTEPCVMTKTILLKFHGPTLNTTMKFGNVFPGLLELLPYTIFPWLFALSSFLGWHRHLNILFWNSNAGWLPTVRTTKSIPSPVVTHQEKHKENPGLTRAFVGNEINTWIYNNSNHDVVAAQTAQAELVTPVTQNNVPVAQYTQGSEVEA